MSGLLAIAAIFGAVTVYVATLPLRDRYTSWQQSGHMLALYVPAMLALGAVLLCASAPVQMWLGIAATAAGLVMRHLDPSRKRVRRSTRHSA